MTTALGVMAVSGGILIALAVLFRVEDARGARFGESVRALFDRAVLAVGAQFARVLGWFGMRSARVTIHYLFHKLLDACLGAVRFVERRVLHLQRKNKRVAKAIQVRDQNPFLGAISKHKQEMALSDEEKRHLRAQKLIQK